MDLTISKRGFIFIIVILGFLAYANILGNGFVWDDEEQIVNNTIIRSLSNLPFLFSSSTFNTGGTASLAGAYYKPLMPLSFMINFTIFGLRAFWFHLFQLTIHLANAVLVFLVTRHLFEQEVKKKTASLLAFLTALFFVVHPGVSEAVAYLSATQDVLFVFFGLLSFILLIKWFEQKKGWILTLSLMSLLGSLLSKEAGIVFIPLILLYLLLFNRSKITYWLLGSAGVVAFYLFLRLGLAKISFTAPHIVPIAQAPLATRLTTIPFELFSYLRLFIFPLSLFISNHQIINSIQSFQFYGYLIIDLALFVLIMFYWFKTKSRLFILFFAWFVLGLGPVLNIIPTDMTVAERWLYLPLIGLLGISCIIIHALVKKFPKSQTLVFYSLAVLLTVFLTRTIIRTFNWRNGLSLYTHDIKLNPGAFDLQNNLGVELYRAGKTNQALTHFEESIKLSGNWWTNYNNAGAIWQGKGDLEKAKIYYQKAIDNGDYYLAWENLALLKLKTEPAQNAWEFIQKGLKVLPYNAQLNMAAALVNYKLGQKEPALGFAKSAYQLNPSDYE
jgi:Tfp pilus assembly protein PilF